MFCSLGEGRSNMFAPMWAICVRFQWFFSCLSALYTMLLGLFQIMCAWISGWSSAWHFGQTGNYSNVKSVAWKMYAGSIIQRLVNALTFRVLFLATCLYRSNSIFVDVNRAPRMLVSVLFSRSYMPKRHTKATSIVYFDRHHKTVIKHTEINWCTRVLHMLNPYIMTQWVWAITTS